MAAPDLRALVIDKIVELGPEAAKAFFGVPPSTIAKWHDKEAMPTLAAAQLVMASNPEVMRPKGIDAEIIKWEGKSVMILTPWYRTANPHTHFTLFLNYAKYGPDKLAMAVKDRTVIHEARNELIHMAKQSKDIKTTITIDDDMILPCGREDVFNGNYRMAVAPASARMVALSRLMESGPEKKIVGALYYGRHEFGMPQCEWGFNAERGVKSNELRAGKHHGYIPMAWVGTGLMKIEMDAIKAFEINVDAGKFPGLEPMPGRWYGYFTPIKAGVGEDVSFCYRMGQIGIQTYLDADLICGHADGGSIWGPRNTSNPTS